MRAKYLMGCVSIHLRIIWACLLYHRQLQQLADHQIIDIRSKRAFEPERPEYSFPQDEKMPKLFQTYLGMQSRLSKQAFYDEDFKCLDYFVFLKLKQDCHFFCDE